MCRIIALLSLVLSFAGFAAENTDACNGNGRPKEGEKMEVTGKLVHPVFAIGGETTGTIIEAEKQTFELELGKNKELLKKVESLKGKKVTIFGTLRKVKGLEVPERRIISVVEIREFVGADEKSKPK